MELNEMRDELMRAVKELREGVHNTINMSAAEQKERDDKINLRIDELQAKMQKPKLPDTADERKDAHAKAFLKWARNGDREAEAAMKAMNITTGADGEYLVPDNLDHQILQLAIEASPIRQLAGHIQLSTDRYEKLVGIHGATGGWVAETTARSNTNTPQFAQLTVSSGEIYASALATQRSLDDAMLDLESYIASEVSDVFSTMEDIAFITGNGVSRPKGFLAGNVVNTADATRTFGDIQYIPTGAAGAWGTGAAGTSDLLFDVEVELKAAYRNGASWLMPKKVLQTIRKWKDTTNNYLWQPSLQAGTPSSLIGYPVTTDENMAAVANNSLSVAFGNFKQAYLVADIRGTRMLRDPYTQKPYVVFYTTKRVGGMLLNSEAIKVLKFAAS